MRRLWVLCLFLSVGGSVAGQEIFLSTLGNVLFRLNLNDCSYQQVGAMPISTTDITFHPDGNLYAITSTGRLFRIDPLAGTSNLVHTFEQSASQLYTSLTASATGIFYTCGLGGGLWSYNPATGTGFFHGNVGYGAEGDLAFYQGNLYMAAVDDNIVRVNIQIPSASTIAIDGNVPGRIFGIITYAASCEDLTMYALTNNSASIYEVDLVNNTLIPFCNIPLQVSGGASTFEFLGSNPITVDDVQTGGFTCGASTGSLQVSATGGVGTLTYSLDGTNFQTSDVFNGLPVDTYTVFITDEVGCTVAADVMLDETIPTITQVAVTNNTCGAANGQLSVTVAGGTPPYQLFVNGAPSTSGLTAGDLPTGTYTLRIEDAAGCTASSQATLNSATVPTLTGTATPTACGLDNGSIALTVAGGQPPLLFSINAGSPQSTETFADLPAGNYTARVTDQNGCVAELPLSVGASSAIVLDSVRVTDTSCGFDNGSVRVYARGGQPPLSYSLPNISNPTASPFFEELLAPGDYVLTVADAVGCEVAVPLAVQASDGVSFADVAVQAATCQATDGQVNIRYIGAVGDVQLSVNDRPESQSDQVMDLAAGAYTLSAVDARGCTAVLDVAVPAANCPIYMPNVFSPNRDGTNDQLAPQAAAGSGIIIVRFQVFDRWGGLVFDRKNLPLGAPELAWNGRRNATDVVPGVYAYQLDVQHPDGQRTRLAGDVLVLW